MDEPIYPEVASFLIRFVKAQPNQDNAQHYRGVVRYVQTDEEISFTSWDEVEAFIRQVIPLEKIQNDKGVDHEIEG
ncbi:MAG TPA: hypothetical protein VJ965_02525 [Anaerolineales bacterium]|nr:hypothetical protein [Anaerolineales bacterium]